MVSQEFKTCIFMTQNQWESGLMNRIDWDNGLSLSYVPAFTGSIKSIDSSCFSVDDCGQIYFIDKKTCHLYKYDSLTQISERITCIGGCGSLPGNFNEPKRMIFDRTTMWVLDKSRILAFSRDNYQVRTIIDTHNILDFALDEEGDLYVLLENKIEKYDRNGHHKSFGEQNLKGPVSLSAGKYIIVIDRMYSGFLIFSLDGIYSGTIGNFSRFTDFKPTFITIDIKGNIITIDSKGSIYYLDPDGSFLSTIPNMGKTANYITTDRKGNLYVSIDKRISVFEAQQSFTQEKGSYYSRSLDRGFEKTLWHRLDIRASIPPKTSVEIYYFSSDDEELKKAIDSTIVDPGKSIQEKASLIETKVQWTGPEYYSGESGPDEKITGMLFREDTSRYLWLKVVLHTFDGNRTPSIKEIRVLHPRDSYLRYLPAIYQENDESRRFLERFLSLFETVFCGIENEIKNVFSYFDPSTTPAQFLSWLATWLDLALEEEWEEDRKRTFIREAYDLFKKKGTPLGIEKFIEIYTGKKAFILEHSKITRPMVLKETGSFKLGINSVLLMTPVRGFRLGEDSILGRTALIETDPVQTRDDPFTQLAYSFTVIVDLSSVEFSSYETGLRRILDDVKPAYTRYFLRCAGDMKGEVYAGINSHLMGLKPLEVGNTTSIGSGIVLMGGERGGKLERHSRSDTDTELI